MQSENGISIYISVDLCNQKTAYYCCFTKLFHDVKIKPGRCKDNWAKSTQRYYGLSWCKEPCDNAIINFSNLASFLPPDFFVISNTSNNIIVGYFTGYLVNGNRAMIEINIFSEATHFQT